MKVLHTSDWHVGRSIRGRSRADEHRAVLAEIVGVARAEAVDLVLVVGDLFDHASPTAESERIVYRALLDLADTGATVIVVAGNHDSDRRLQAVEPLLRLGQVVTRPTFARPDEGGLVEVTSRDGEERARVAVLPFLSQRWVVRAADLMGHDSDDHAGKYAARVKRLVAELTAGFGPGTVNLVAAHLMAVRGQLGGGERLAHTVFDYGVESTAFPASAHYVALGHLHRSQRIAGPCPIHYCGSPLALDFGEESDAKSVLVVEAHPGLPATVIEVPLSSGRQLRTVRGRLADLADVAATDDPGDTCYLRVVVQEEPRIGLADEVRELFPSCVDVVVERPASERAGPARPTLAGRSPSDLFDEYLAEQQAADPRLSGLFGELLEEAGAPAPA